MVDIALKTPVAEGRQGADSEKRPTEVRRSGSESHFWDISESSLRYQASEDLQHWKIPWPTAGTGSLGGRGAKGDIYRQAYSRGVPDLGRRTFFFGAGTGGAWSRRVYSVSTFSKKTP